MTKSHRMRSLAALITALALLVTPLALPGMAETTGEQTDRSIFFGKVTQIDGDYVTVAIATMDMPQMPDQGNAGGQSSNGQSGNPPAGNDGQQRGGWNFAGSLTLTGELVTVQITNAVTLTKQGARPEGQGTMPGSGDAGQQGGRQGQDSQGNAPSRPEGTPPAGGDRQWERGQGGFGGFNMFSGGEAATFSDLTVDAIVMLTYQTSTQALLAVHIFSVPEASAN